MVAWDSVTRDEVMRAITEYNLGFTVQAKAAS
jgi:hypothetical protein